MNFFFSSRRRHTRSLCDWSSDVCSSDLHVGNRVARLAAGEVDRVVAAPARRHHRVDPRSEERRVGKECRCRWWRYHKKKKMKKDERTEVCGIKSSLEKRYVK